MRQALQRAWLRRGPLACVLWPLSVLFGGLAALRRALYRRGWLSVQHAGVPVLVVGNVVAGGAGKTPVVIALAQRLAGAGIEVGVISRGHGRRGKGVLEVRADADPRDTGDEPLLIARRTGVPVFVAPRRIDAALALRRAHPGVQLIVCDDGLQHLALARDIELCVFDDRGIGNGWLLPAGPLRERWPRPADLVLRSAGASGISGHVVERRLAGHALRGDGTRLPLEQLRGRRCRAVAGIASPERFFEMLRAQGIELTQATALADHHDFTRAAPAADGVPLLCTEKDAVKLWRLQPQALAVPLEVDLPPAFWRTLNALLGPKLSSTDGP